MEFANQQISVQIVRVAMTAGESQRSRSSTGDDESVNVREPRDEG
jgi:hypothetical protein